MLTSAHLAGIYHSGIPRESFNGLAPRCIGGIRPQAEWVAGETAGTISTAISQEILSNSIIRHAAFCYVF